MTGGIGRLLMTLAATLGCIVVSRNANSDGSVQNFAPKSGSSYASAEIRALQADDSSNPGMLWVANGETLWYEGAGGTSTRSCAQCHDAASTSMKGVATRYPQIESRSAPAQLINLEGRINLCRVRHQSVAALAYESPEMLALSAYVSHQSRGIVRSMMIDDGNRAYFKRGEGLYQQRLGQMNLACTHCHNQNAGKTLLAEKISEGQSNGYPIYRLEWQGMGSLHRRFRSCLNGIRAEPFAPGSDEYLALELYIAWRGNGLAIETPAVRR